MSDQLTGKHYACPRCNAVTQFIDRGLLWVCQSCQAEQPADDARQPASYAELMSRKEERP